MFNFQGALELLFARSQARSVSSFAVALADSFVNIPRTSPFVNTFLNLFLTFFADTTYCMLNRVKYLHVNK